MGDSYLYVWDAKIQVTNWLAELLIIVFGDWALLKIGIVEIIFV